MLFTKQSLVCDHSRPEGSLQFDRRVALNLRGGVEMDTTELAVLAFAVLVALAFAVPVVWGLMRAAAGSNERAAVQARIDRYT